VVSNRKYQLLSIGLPFFLIFGKEVFLNNTITRSFDVYQAYYNTL